MISLESKETKETVAAETADANEKKAALTEMEMDAIGEILNISLGSSATSVSQLLGKPVNITTPHVELVKTEDFDIHLYEPAIGVEIQYVEGLSGKNLLILKRDDIKTIVGLLLQKDFKDEEFVLDEMNLGAVCEVMNQMMGAAATALSQFLNRTVNISPPQSFEIQGNDQFKERYLTGSESIVTVTFDLQIDDLVNSKFINVMKTDLAKELVDNFGLSADDGGEQPEVQAAAPAAAPAPAAAQVPAAAPVAAPVSTAAAPAAAVQASAPAAAPMQPAPAVVPTMAQAQPFQSSEPAPNYTVSSAVYPSFDASKANLSKGETNNLNMILTVPLQITVEIGRTTKKIKEILDFSPGTIVELNRQAGSQVDVYVNGKAIAKGTVVVVDDNYGVRITEVMNSELMKLI